METFGRRFPYYPYAKVIPLVFDDSLSYYEVLCKLTDKVNEIIDNYTNAVGGKETVYYEMPSTNILTMDFDKYYYVTTSATQNTMPLRPQWRDGYVDEFVALVTTTAGTGVVNCTFASSAPIEHIATNDTTSVTIVGTNFQLAKGQTYEITIRGTTCYIFKW